MKKINKILVASALMIPAMAVSFVGCTGDKDPHTHAGEEYYSISEDKTTAYSHIDCSCGKTVTKTIKNALIVNPDNAQAIFDGYYDGTEYDINNKTIVFSEGVYGPLQLRATQYAVDHVYAYDEENKKVVGEEITDLSQLANEGYYHYERAFNNITFAGTEGAVFQGQIMALSRDMHGYTYPYQYTYGLTETDTDNDCWYDYVRNIPGDRRSEAADGDGIVAYVQHLALNNITFNRGSFSTKRGEIVIVNNAEKASLKNLTIKNCRFESTEASKNAAISISVAGGKDGIISNKYSENILIKDNFIKGYYQGVYIQNPKDVVVCGNEIENSNVADYSHNLIAMQAVDNAVDQGSYVTGKIVIKNNVLKNTKDRAIRFNACVGAEIEIANNTISNATDPDDKVSFLKTGNLTDTKFTFVNNTYNGNATRQVVNGTESSYIFSTSDEI